MTKLRLFIDDQRSDLQARMQPLSEKCAELRTSLKQTEEALKSLQAEWAELERARNALDVAEAESAVESANPGITIKEAVMHVLSDYPTGLSAREILREINSRYYEGRLKRESLSPQLTRLQKDDKKLVLRGSLWIPK